MPSIDVVLGDITTVAVEAIVKAATNGMRGRGGVDEAIHPAGGPAILTDRTARFPNGLATGTLGGPRLAIYLGQPIPQVPVHRQQDHLGREAEASEPEGILTGGPGRRMRFIEPPPAPPVEEGFDGAICGRWHRCRSGTGRRLGPRSTTATTLFGAS